MEARKKKIAVYMVVYGNYTTDPRVRKDAETLAASDEFAVMVVAPKQGDEPRTAQLNGVSIVELDASRYRGKSISGYLASYLKFVWAAFRHCSRLALRGEIDVVHIHNMPDFLIFSAVVPRLMGKQVILDIHDSVPETFIGKFRNHSGLLFRLLCMEESICCRLAHRIICVNHPQRDLLASRGIPIQKMAISMNVPDERWFGNGASDPREEKSGNGFNLVYHGTLAKRLGVDLTIRAVSNLHGRIPGLKFHVIGSGDDQDELFALAERLGVSSCVEFHGSIPIDRIASTLRSMNLGVISNRRNIATELMLPVKMLEYVALGIPVVAPPLKTIKHYFSDDMLGYFEAENVESLSATILDAWQSREEWRNRANQAKRFLVQYGWEKQKLEFIDLYRSIVSPSRILNGQSVPEDRKEIASC